MKIKKGEIITLIFFLFWLLIQFVFVYAYGTIDVSTNGDPQSYRYLALQSINNGTLYPSQLNYHDNFIFSPGYVNYIILIYSIFGTLKAILYSQVVLNALIVILLYITTKQLFDCKISIVSVWIYMLLSSNLLSPVFGYTELLFIFLSLLSVYLSISNKWYHLLSSGVILALANWVRPLAIAWLIGTIVYYIISKYNYKQIIYYIVGYCLMLLSIACITKTHFSDYNYASTTGGWNLIMGANDDCTGNYNDNVFKEGNIGYLTREEKQILSYKQQDSVYMARSVNWIIENPIKYISYLPIKAKELFLYDNQYNMSGDIITSQNKFVYILSKITFSNKIVRIIGNLFYWGLLTLSLFSLLYYRNKKIILLQSIILITTFMTLITVGHPRYHQIFMPYIIMSASFVLWEVINKTKFYKKHV
jgi:hypothetical protein